MTTAEPRLTSLSHGGGCGCKIAPGVLCAIAREKPIPVYFIGVGEKLEDLETFDAREFAQALLS